MVSLVNARFPYERPGSSLHHAVQHVDCGVVWENPFSDQVHCPEKNLLELYKRSVHGTKSILELQCGIDESASRTNHTAGTVCT